MARHLVVYWNPTPTPDERAEVGRWSAEVPNAEIVLEQDLRAAQAAASSGKERLAALIAKAGTDGAGLPWLQKTRMAVGEHVFSILYSRTVSRDAKGRITAMEQHGISMVTHRQDDLVKALQQVTAYPIASERAKNPSSFPYDCPVCKLPHLDSHDLWVHMPLFHLGLTKSRSVSHTCPICQVEDNVIVVHMHDVHAPPGHPPDTSRGHINLYSFGLVVVQRQRDKKFLVVQEFASQGYWLPGGGIDAGEQPTKAALRECIEEVGVRVKLTGILRIEVSPHKGYVRMRYIFYGEPEDENDCEPKTLPDFESAGACWVTAEEVLSGRIKLRGSEPLDWFDYVDRGGTIHDMTLLDLEGAPPPQVPRASS
jgi:8-oxo-dGTP pyrophosphatase MutT (NUDIX family)